MNIATIAALAVTLGLPAPAQQSATKIITENGQPLETGHAVIKGYMTVDE